MWFFSEALFDYLKERSIGWKIVDMFLVLTVFSWIAAAYMVATNFSDIKKVWIEKTVDMKSLVQLDKSINEVLTTAMQGIDSDRASLSRFHDSVTAVGGRHFVYESRSNEVVQPGVSLVAQLRQNSLISMINLWAQSFIKNECVYMTNIAPTDQFYEFYRQIGTKSDIKCPVYNTSGILVGYLDFEFTTHEMSVQDMKLMEPKVRDAASKIGAILSIGNIQ